MRYNIVRRDSGIEVASYVSIPPENKIRRWYALMAWLQPIALKTGMIYYVTTVILEDMKVLGITSRLSKRDMDATV